MAEQVGKNKKACPGILESSRETGLGKEVQLNRKKDAEYIN